MRKPLTFFLVALFLGPSLFAQSQAETTIEQGGTKILKGLITREALQGDSSFRWYAENQKSYTPNAVALDALKQYGDSVQIIAFMGTWCGDSHSIVPKFYSLLDAAGYASSRVTLVGVDRSKKTLAHMAEALDIKNVPTFIVMKNGKELGRVVEYGKYGMWDKELGEVVLTGFKKPL